MNFKNFDINNDVVTTYLDVPSNLYTISTTAQASNSGVWLMVLNSTSANYITKPDTTQTASNVSISSAFKQIANFFYGTGSYIIDANNGTTQNSTVRIIQFARPNLGEGLYKNSITAKINSNNQAASLSLTAVDIPDNNSINSALGLTGKLVNSALSTDVWGSVFYDYGVMVFSHSQGATGSIFSSTVSGFEIGTASATKVRLTELNYKTRSILKRAIYFCRAYNKEFNYTYNPTARQSDGKILGTLSANPATFVSTIGLYNENDDLLAVAKVSPVKKKSFQNEVNFRVQIDF